MGSTGAGGFHPRWCFAQIGGEAMAEIPVLRTDRFQAPNASCGLRCSPASCWFHFYRSMPVIRLDSASELAPKRPDSDNRIRISGRRSRGGTP